jgi:hypothetical protein
VDGVDLTKATGRAARATMAASKHAYYCPEDWWVLQNQMAEERGERIELGLLWNDRRTRTDGPVAAERQPIRELPVGPFAEQLMVHVDDVPGTVQLTVEVDTRHLGMAELGVVLDRMESVVLDGHCP